MIRSVEPTSSAFHDLGAALGVDEHPHPRDALAHPVDVLGQEAVVDRAMPAPQQHLGRPGPLRVEAALVAVGIPDHAVGLLEAHGEGGVAAQMLVGEEQHPLGPLERPGHGPGRVRGGADGAAFAAGERLDRGRGVHVGQGHGPARQPLLEDLPGLVDLGEGRHVGHGAAGGQVGQDDLLVVAGQDVGRLGHEVDPAEDHELGLGPGRGLLGQAEGVAAGVGELDHLVALVVVAEDERPLAQGSPGRPGPLDQLGVGRRGQVARAGGALLGGSLGAEQVEEDSAGGHRSLRREHVNACT
jgi:hypothetical protein